MFGTGYLFDHAPAFMSIVEGSTPDDLVARSQIVACGPAAPRKAYRAQCDHRGNWIHRFDLGYLFDLRQRRRAKRSVD